MVHHHDTDGIKRKFMALSVMHTGSRALVHALRPRVDCVTDQMMSGYTFGDCLVDTHLYPEPDQGVDPETLDERNLEAFEQRKAERAAFDKLVQTVPIIAPVVDPLKSLCTAMHRQSVDPKVHVDVWVEMASIAEQDNVTTIWMGRDDTAEQIAVWCDAQGLYEGPIDLLRVRVSGNNPLKTAYANGDLAHVEATIPGQLAYLRTKQDVIEPWLGHFDWMG